MATSKIPWIPGSQCPDSWGSDTTVSWVICVTYVCSSMYVGLFCRHSGYVKGVTDPSLLPYMCTKVIIIVASQQLHPMFCVYECSYSVRCSKC